jgi:hypothetical protein
VECRPWWLLNLRGPCMGMMEMMGCRICSVEDEPPKVFCTRGNLLQCGRRRVVMSVPWCVPHAWCRSSTMHSRGLHEGQTYQCSQNMA